MLTSVWCAAGVGLYNAVFKTVPLKKMLLGAMLLGVGLGSTQLLLVSGYNRVLGLSHESFVLGDSVILTVLGQVSHSLPWQHGVAAAAAAASAMLLAAICNSRARQEPQATGALQQLNCSPDSLVTSSIHSKALENRADWHLAAVLWQGWRWLVRDGRSAVLLVLTRHVLMAST